MPSRLEPLITPIARHGDSVIIGFNRRTGQPVRGGLKKERENERRRKKCRPPSDTPISFDAIQTFRVDPLAINGAATAYLSSIEIYVKSKPAKGSNVSGSSAPGISISICEVSNEIPDIDRILIGSDSRVPYEEVYSFSDASVPTIFRFLTPIPLDAGSTYGIVISPEDSSYEFWVNQKGDKLVGTNQPSPGSNNPNDGKYYLKTNSGEFTAKADIDLKYRVNIAKFSANTATINLVNKDFEFLTISGKTGSFVGGEYVYQEEANSAGNVAITQGNTTLVGDGTDFTAILNDGFIVVWDGVSNTQTLQVQSVSNSTYLTLETVPRFTNAVTKFMIAPVASVYYRNDLDNKIILVDSSANSTLGFDAAGTIVGDISRATATVDSVDSYLVDQFVPRFSVDSTPSASIDVDYVISSSNTVNTSLLEPLVIDEINKVTKYSGEILSRTTEVGLSDLYGNNKKSGLARFQVNVNQATDSLYNVPAVLTDEIDFFVWQNKINDVYLDGNIDTEVYKNGLATSKYISEKTAFANNRFAEDIKVFMTAYRPVGTEIRVYAKLHNSVDTETFDDKLWTHLEYTAGEDLFSSSSNTADLIEFELGMPIYPDSDFTVSGSFTTELSNTVILANGFDPSANLVAGDLVKIYNPLVEENYTISFVESANTTAVVLADAIANNNVVGSGYYVDKLLYKGTAFKNKENDNVSRYFTLSQSAVDKFNSMQFKIVLLANNSAIVPEVETFEAIGLNAGA